MSTTQVICSILCLATPGPGLRHYFSAIPGIVSVYPDILRGIAIVDIAVYQGEIPWDISRELMIEKRKC